MKKIFNKFFLIFKKPVNPDIDQLIKRRTIISFLYFSFAIVIAFLSWSWLIHQPESKAALKPLREAMKVNEKLFGGLFYDNNHLAPLFDKSKRAKEIRVNGDIGMGDDFDEDSWSLKVVRAPGDTLFISLDDIKKLPKTEIVFDFKCVEGWDQVSHWGGVKFSDFIEKYNLGTTDKLKADTKNFSNLYLYTGLVTPDEEYYVGMDMPSMMHPQTLLCYEMNGEELDWEQGYPLRLITTVKYGVKSIKRIGTIFFSNDPPPDYWYENGYDYYLGL